MRLWTIHPKYLDARGLVALWREGLLAQKVLLGQTKGYRNHPQLIRFKNQTNPIAAITTYLYHVYLESQNRNYQFNSDRIFQPPSQIEIQETSGQLHYEWSHLLVKLKIRNPVIFELHSKIQNPESHPIFKIVQGKIQTWEIVPNASQL